MADRPVYDRDGMIDENERRAFVEEQEADEERAFEEFVATRKHVTGLEYVQMGADRVWEDHPNQELLIYEDSYEIEVCDDGRYMLTLGNLGWITGENGETLETLERRLFEYAKDN
jgi:hypothetical protein